MYQPGEYFNGLLILMTGTIRTPLARRVKRRRRCSGNHRCRSGSGGNAAVPAPFHPSRPLHVSRVPAPIRIRPEATWPRLAMPLAPEWGDDLPHYAHEAPTLLQLCDAANEDSLLTSEHGELLYDLVRHEQPELIIEIGMGRGLCSAILAQALADNQLGRLICIDPGQRSSSQGEALALLARTGLSPRVELCEQAASAVLPRLEQRGLRPQLAYLHAGHDLDELMTAYHLLDRSLDTGGVLALARGTSPVAEEVARYAISQRGYLPVYLDRVPLPAERGGFIERALRTLGGRFPAVGRHLRPATLLPAHMIGLHRQCLLLRKTRPTPDL